MNKAINALLAKYRGKGLLVDTNILLLYIVGTSNRDRISKFKRTRQFVPEDFDLLKKILVYSQRVITTPNILTEVNSLANQLGEPERSHCLSLFSRVIEKLEESYQKSTLISNLPDFQRFGLTDCSILNLAKNKYLVLTDDLKLVSHLASQGIDVVNFNNLRELGWK